MKSETAIRIASKAIALLDNYGGRPQDLLPREGERIHLELKEFANSVVYLEHANDWGNGSFIKAEVAKDQVPLFVAADVGSLQLSGYHLQGYGSWLYRNFAGSYAAVFDERLIAVMAPAVRAKEMELKTKLFLHELGHFVLHRNDLFNGHKSTGLAASAIAEMEAEAWFFAYVILGLAKGDRAALTTASIDNTWLLP
jgi:hypothetical protein